MRWFGTRLLKPEKIEAQLVPATHDKLNSIPWVVYTIRASKSKRPPEKQHPLFGAPHTDSVTVMRDEDFDYVASLRM